MDARDMTDATRSPTASASDRPAQLVLGVIGLLDRLPAWLLGLAARLSIATVFWRSGQTKVSGWTITDSTFFLFEEEYKVPLISPEVAAYLATWAEHLFPVLLVIGLASRFSALALLGMTAVIQVFVYPDAWPTHALWASALLYIVGRGPGALSVDHLIRRRFRGAADRRA
jgi:putative oxidoreductase